MGANPVEPEDRDDDTDAIVELVPMLRKVIGSRVRDPHIVEDLVQETLARVMAARSRVERDTLAPYAVVTARNLIASHGAAERAGPAQGPSAGRAGRVGGARTRRSLQREERRCVAQALDRLADHERDLLLAHEVEGQDTASLAAAPRLDPGAIAAQLTRTRARLRVEYLLAQSTSNRRRTAAGPCCAPLGGDRRRQRELDTAGHLLACDCARG